MQLPVDLPRGFAIIYGVADYEYINDLNFSDDDAQSIYDLLTSQAQGFNPDDVILRTNAQATKAQLDLDFEYMSDRIRSLSNPGATRFVFYYAGHGYGDGMTQYYSFSPAWNAYFSDASSSSEPLGAGLKTEYLLLYGMSVSAPTTVDEVGEELDREAESDDDLAAHLESIPSLQRIVIIDACHSGGFVGDGPYVDSVPRSFEGDGMGISGIDGITAISIFAGGSGTNGADIGPDTVVMSAAGEQEFSYEYAASAGISNGVFTHYLLMTPSSADVNMDGLVTVSEAYSYTVFAIEALENPYLTLEDKFIPRLGSSSVDFVLFFAN